MLLSRTSPHKVVQNVTGLALRPALHRRHLATGWLARPQHNIDYAYVRRPSSTPHLPSTDTGNNGELPDVPVSAQPQPARAREQTQRAAVARTDNRCMLPPIASVIRRGRTDVQQRRLPGKPYPGARKTLQVTFPFVNTTVTHHGILELHWYTVSSVECSTSSTSVPSKPAI